MKLSVLNVLVLLSAVTIVNTDAKQISDCYSIDNHTQSIEFICKTTNEIELRNISEANECISRLFDENGLFASEKYRNEIKQLKINGCKNDFDHWRFSKFKNVNVIDISHANLYSLEYFQTVYRNLQVLNASFNQLSVIPSHFYLKMPQIKVFDISHNSLMYDYGQDFSNYHKLTILNLSHNEMSTIYKQLPSNLLELDISNNRLKSINFEAFYGLNTFHTLNIMNNPMAIDCDFLQILLLPFTTLYSLDNVNAIHFQCLVEFDLKLSIDIADDVRFEILDQKIQIRRRKSWFKQLRELRIGYNVQGDVKPIINLLGSSVERLHLSGIQIGEIDINPFREFNHLIELRLSNAGLSSFNLSHINNISNLEVLDISGNNLKEIQGVTFLSKAINLKQLHLQDNQITNIKGLINHLGSSVNMLKISGNYVGEITSNTFSTCNKLEYLHMCATNLTRFDFSSIEYLTNLKVLEICNNNFEFANFTIPSNEFTQMEYLDLNMNKLTELDTLSPVQFPGIVVLKISHNRFNCSYSKLFKLRWRKLHAYMNLVMDGCLNETETSRFVSDIEQITTGKLIEQLSG